ncbi:MAG TPA: type II secretion system protein [Acidimicrobiales bacterium]|jgi:type IV pilus assembly protein PilA
MAGQTRPDRARRNEQGFTLIELMVVILIVAILMAVAVPTYLRARQVANDRAVQTNVRNALTATRIFYNDGASYSPTPADMVGVEPSLTWTNDTLDATATERSIFIAVYDTPSTAQTVVVGGRTSEGRCFFIRDVMGGITAGTYYDEDVDGGTDCPAPDPAVITQPSWD